MSPVAQCFQTLRCVIRGCGFRRNFRIESRYFHAAVHFLPLIFRSNVGKRDEFQANFRIRPAATDTS